MPRSKTGKKRVPVHPEAMYKAVKAISSPGERKIPIREACKIYNVKFTTLVRHLQSFKQSGREEYSYDIKYDTKKVFNDTEETSLVQYIQTIAKMKYGLTKKGVRVLAYKYTVANNKKRPSKWDEDEIAVEEWMWLFMKRHTKALSIRKPDVCGFEFKIQFFKRIGVSSKFISESQDVFDVNEEDILVKLPKPTDCSGSARRTGCVFFEVDFTNYNVK